MDEKRIFEETKIRTDNDCTGSIIAKNMGKTTDFLKCRMCGKMDENVIQPYRIRV